jgi:hypothetical protein
MSAFDDLEAKAKATAAKDLAEVESTARKYRGYVIAFLTGLVLGLIIPHL